MIRMILMSGLLAGCMAVTPDYDVTVGSESDSPAAEIAVKALSSAPNPPSAWLNDDGTWTCIGDGC